MNERNPDMNDPTVNAAPNGKPSNLSPEDWAYVRSTEFKAWAGDWEKGQSAVLLDENGEPKLLYHGSTKAFDRFDLSKGGANTGGGWYKDHRTGDAIPIDSERCIFFTDSFHQAASYAFLGHFIDMSHITRDLTAAIAGIRSAELPISFGFKTKEDFVATIRRLEPLVPSLKKLTFPISSIPKEQREAIVSPLLPLRDQYRAAAQQMERGGLSNQHYNSYRQAAAVESLCRNFDRLRKNDLDVRNEFGTFRDYNATICGHSGNAEIYIFADDAGRLVYRGPAGREYFDAMTDERGEEVKQEMRDVSEGCQRRFEETVEQSGYDAAAYIYKVFLKAESPLAHDYAGSAFPDKYKPNEKYGTGYVAARQVAKAIREGNDMVVYEHIRDPFEATSYGVFSPDQVLIRQRQHGILPHLQGRDIVRLKKIGATDDEVLALEHTKTAVIQAPFAYLGVSPSEASPRLENTPMTLEWRNNGIFVKTAAGATEPLGTVCHQMAQDRGYLSRTLRQSAPAVIREPQMEQERTTALRR